MKPQNSLDSQLAAIKKKIEEESSLIPEYMHGFAALYWEEEDFTCFQAKRLYGKREKGELKRVF
ncbi:MAG: hypothetical protein ACP5IE_05240 [Infirmifilum sp.]